MEGKKIRFSELILYALAFIGFFAVLSEIGDYIHRNEPDLNYNPRHAENGIDTVYTKDSIYTINVTVRSVEAKPEKPQDSEKDY